MNDFFKDNDSKTAREAQYEAQKIAFAPIIFQVAKTLRNLGILELLHNNKKTGLDIQSIAEELNLDKNNVKVLLETALSSDVVKIKDNNFFITKTGFYLFKDEMTMINMNYNHDVNYQGLFHLEDAIKTKKAEGLKVFGEWDTIYPALSSLPQKAKQSWFEFDHFYSDSAFSDAIKIIKKDNPQSVLDIGGNTGKFSIQLANNSENIKVTIADLPEQINLAMNNIKSNNLSEKVNFFPLNILDSNDKLPSGFDIIWMSQFLDCFKEDDIISILSRVKESKSNDTKVYIMEPLWDKQEVEAGAYCIINTSPYFTAMANGYSKMFNSWDMIDYIEKSGLEIIDEIHNVGICQSILICK